jgi:hypothetical protein
MQSCTVQFNNDGEYTVTLTVGNVNGSVPYTKNSFVVIGGLPLPFYDDFESGTVNSKAWEITNPNNDRTWEVIGTGGNGPGNKSARVFIFGTNSYGRRDRLITPPLDLTTLGEASLFFKHAYAQYQTDYTDSLIIYASDDCGSHWTRLYSTGDDGTGSFATHAPQIFSFIPNLTTDWCGGPFGSECLVVNLDAYAGKKNVRIAFETVSGLSNNIYIDDVWIDSPDAIQESDLIKNIILYPNPSKGIFTLESTSNQTVQSLSVYSAFGQCILKMNARSVAAGEKIVLDLKDHAGGIYFLQLDLNGKILTQKLIVQ